jgi:hypothetical protein
VVTPAGLARWRAAFPAGRTLVLAGAAKAPPLRDSDVAPVAGWDLTGVHASDLATLTRSGLASLCGPALTALCLWGTRQLSGADVAAATAASRRLRVVHLRFIGALTDADLAAWGGVHDLTVYVQSQYLGGFTWDGVRHLTAARELELPLLPGGDNWAGDAFRGLAHLTHLGLTLRVGAETAAVHGPAGLLAPGSLPRSLQRVALDSLRLVWPPGAEPDGGAALLRPLAGMPDVWLDYCCGVGDGGLCALTGATRRLELYMCVDVAGEHLAPLGRTLQELTVSCCHGFTGGGLGSLAALRWLRVACCRAFQAGALVGVAGGCAALERVDVTWDRVGPQFEIAAAEAALLAAAGGGAWAFTRGSGTWGATGRWPHAAPAPAAGGAGGHATAPTAAAPCDGAAALAE